MRGGAGEVETERRGGSGSDNGEGWQSGSVVSDAERESRVL